MIALCLRRRRLRLTWILSRSVPSKAGSQRRESRSRILSTVVLYSSSLFTTLFTRRTCAGSLLLPLHLGEAKLPRGTWRACALRMRLASHSYFWFTDIEDHPSARRAVADVEVRSIFLKPAQLALLQENSGRREWVTVASATRSESASPMITSKMMGSWSDGGRRASGTETVVQFTTVHPRWRVASGAVC